MFSLLEARSLQPVAKRNHHNSGLHKLQWDQSCKKGFTQKRIGVHSFVGTKSKSRNGCDGCRRRKKRCDEAHPVCGACDKRNLECEWGYSTRNNNGNRRKLFPQTKSEESVLDKSVDVVLDLVLVSEFDHEIQQLLLSPVLDLFASGEIEQNVEEGVEEIEEIEEIGSLTDLEDVGVKGSFLRTVFAQAMDEMFNANSPQQLQNQLLLLVPASSRLLLPATQSSHLDSQGGLCWEFYKYKGAMIVCVGVDHYNHFTQCYMKLGEQNEAICNLVAAWGGLYLKDGPEHSMVQRLAHKGMSVMPKCELSVVMQCKIKKFWTLFFYGILYMFYVCSGDTQRWWTVYLKLKEIIDLSGGIQKLCEEYNYSNDIVFLMSLFQYTSCTSSFLWITGPIYPVTEYEEVFSHVDFRCYGVDSVQGAFQTIYWRLLEVATYKIELEKQQKQVDEIYGMALTAEFEDDVLNEQYKLARKKYAERSALLFDTMMDKIRREQPSSRQLMLINDTREEQLQCDIFEAYQKVCQLYCYFHLKGSSPLTTEVQVLLDETLVLVECLLKSKMRVSMVLPLLTCSMAAVTDFDKTRIVRCFRQLRHACAVYNVEIASELAHEIWRRNPDGSRVVSWADICHEKSWQMCAC